MGGTGHIHFDDRDKKNKVKILDYFKHRMIKRGKIVTYQSRSPIQGQVTSKHQ